MTSGVYLRKTAAERFWEKVEVRDGCWTWRGVQMWSGYGMFWLEGRYQRAHRVAYILGVGPVPDGLFVLHHCDNRACVRPDHLYAGTHQDNMRDRQLRGRTARGKRGKVWRPLLLAYLERVEG